MCCSCVPVKWACFGSWWARAWGLQHLCGDLRGLPNWLSSRNNIYEGCVTDLEDRSNTRWHLQAQLKLHPSGARGHVPLQVLHPIRAHCYVALQVFQDLTISKAGEEAALNKYLNDAGLATTRIVVHEVSQIEPGRGDTCLDSVRALHDSQSLDLVSIQLHTFLFFACMFLPRFCLIRNRFGRVCGSRT
jgi:hypothetical protein